jgi:hypothetical protein
MGSGEWSGGSGNWYLIAVQKKKKQANRLRGGQGHGGRDSSESTVPDPEVASSMSGGNEATVLKHSSLHFTLLLQRLSGREEPTYVVLKNNHN